MKLCHLLLLQVGGGSALTADQLAACDALLPAVWGLSVHRAFAAVQKLVSASGQLRSSWALRRARAWWVMYTASLAVLLLLLWRAGGCILLMPAGSRVPRIRRATLKVLLCAADEAACRVRSRHR